MQKHESKQCQDKYDKRDGKEVIKFLIPTSSMTVKELGPQNTSDFHQRRWKVTGHDVKVQ